MALGLGSNLGDRIGRLAQGVAAIDRFVRVEALSSVYESDPVGYEDQPPFLNAVVIGRTRLAPDALLDRVAGIEAEAGRRRSFPAAPRTLDIDILLIGDMRIDRPPRLVVPHPALRDRSFVLAPLNEVAADWTEPVTGRTVEALWEELREVLPPVRRIAPPGALTPDRPRKDPS